MRYILIYFVIRTKTHRCNFDLPLENNGIEASIQRDRYRFCNYSWEFAILKQKTRLFTIYRKQIKKWK